MTSTTFINKCNNFSLLNLNLDIKKSRTPGPNNRNKYNRQPKNVEVKRVISSKKKPKNGLALADQNSKFEYLKMHPSGQQEPNVKVGDDMKAQVKNKIVEFTCGLLDLPALKRKYLSKTKRNKQKKYIKNKLRKSVDNEENGDITNTGNKQKKTKLSKPSRAIL